jgi:hypothetical protein
MGGNIHDIYINQSCSLRYKKLKPKVVNIFLYDSKLWQFIKTKWEIWKNLHILKNSYLFNNDNTKHVMYWSNYMYFNNKLQKISFKNSFIWKNEKN